MSILYEQRSIVFDSYTWEKPNYLPHLHEHIEFVYVISGCIELTINGTVYSLKKSDCAMIRPNHIHSYKDNKNSKILLVIADILSIKEIKNEMEKKFLVCPVFSCNELSATGAAAIDLFRAESNRGEKTFTNTDKGLLMILLDDVFRNLPICETGSISDLTITQKALTYIDKNLGEDLTEKELAAQIGVSKYYLSRLFVRDLHMSFPTYMNSRRIQSAADLLRTTSLSIAEAAYEAGFSNIRSFNRNFMKEYGITPTEWRNDII